MARSHAAAERKARGTKADTNETLTSDLTPQDCSIFFVLTCSWAVSKEEQLLSWPKSFKYHLRMNKLLIASTIATIVQSGVVIVSLIFIWRQVQLQTKQLNFQTDLAKAANTQALVSLSSPFNISLIQHPQIAKLWIEGAEDFESYGKIDRFRYETLLFWWLILHENVYYQKHKGLLDEVIYAAWEYDLRHFIKRQNLQLHWDGLKNLFQQEFRDHVGQVIRELRNEQTSHRHQC